MFEEAEESEEEGHLLGEVLYDPDTTTLEELTLLIEEQLGVQVDINHMSCNHVRPLTQEHLNTLVSTIFPSQTDILSVRVLK